jgi:integrase
VVRIYDKLEGESLKPFYAGIKTEATKENYATRLNQFLQYEKTTPDEFVKLAIKYPKKAENLIGDFIAKRKADKVSPATIATTRDALRLLLDMNSAKKIDWNIINKMLPKVKHYGNDRPPTIEEIRNLLLHADMKLKCAILFLVSSGARIGAIDYLNWGDIEEIKHRNLTLAMLKIYSGEPEKYETLITPESYQALLEYRKVREQAGEKIGRNSPVFINDFDKRTAPKEGVNAKRASSKVIRNRLGVLWNETVEREEVKSSGISPRYEFKQVHGFRKFFKSTCEKYMKSLFVELLMGHSIGVSNSYMKPTTKELVEEYVKVIPHLTIQTPNQPVRADEMKHIARRESLLNFGWSESELDKKGDLSILTSEQIQVMIEEKKNQLLGLNGNGRQKVVPMSEMRNYIEQGWEFLTTLPTNEAVVGLPRH